MLNRRRWMAASAAALLLPQSVRARPLPAAVDTSPLIYLTPLCTDGSESRCQAEIWFVRDAELLYVVTAHDAWRATAVAGGLDRARIWVGDVGTWSRGGRHRQLPSIETRAARVTDPAVHARVLARYGEKYSDEWSTWGPRFRNGLADGSRVMLSYRAV